MAKTTPTREEPMDESRERGADGQTAAPTSSTNAVAPIDSVRWIARVQTGNSTFDVRVGSISELMKKDAE
jgi:hypothetical protein